MDGRDTQPHAFSLTQELALSAELAAVLWSPTMDVAAALSRDGSLQLHRMDWSPLWASAPASRITALVWRPDGRALATGHADGSLSLLDVESGEVLAQHRAHFASITSLCWAEDAADNSSAAAPLRTPESGADDVANNCATTGGSALAGLGDNASLSAANHSIAPHERYKRLFVPPVLQPYAPSSTEPPPPPYALSIDTPGAPAWPASECGSSMSLLAAADARGSVSLWLRGQVQIAEVAAALHSNGSGNGGAGGADEDGTAAGSCSDGTQQDYRLLHVMPDSQLMQLLIVHQAPSGAVALAAHSLGILQDERVPLQQCTSLFAQLLVMLRAAVRCIEVCSRDWAAAISDVQRRLHQQLLDELAAQGSSVTDPWQELLLLLATGSATPPLATFLSGTLGEAGLRRLARGLDSTAAGLHTALAERLVPLLSLVLFLLGELRGAVAVAGGAAPPAQGWLGLQVSLLARLELRAAAAALRVEQLRALVVRSASEYRCLFSWLLGVVRALDGGGADGAALLPPPGAGGEAPPPPPAALPLPAVADALAVLRGQMRHDVIGQQLTDAPLQDDALQHADAALHPGVPSEQVAELLALLAPHCPCVECPSSTSDAAAAAAAAAADGSDHHAQRNSEHPGAALRSEAKAAVEEPLARQLRHLLSEAEEAFEAPVLELSQGLTCRAALLPLLPAAPDSSSSSSAASAALGVSFAPPQLQPSVACDTSTHIVCAVPHAAASAAAGECGSNAADLPPSGRQLLLLVKVSSTPQQQQQQQQLLPPAESSACGLEPLNARILLLALPVGMEAADWAVYRASQLAVVLLNSSDSVPGTQALAAATAAAAAAAGTDHPCCSSLCLFDLTGAPWVPLHTCAGAPSALTQCIAAGAHVHAEALPRRMRALPTSASGRPTLALSRGRGLASVLSDAASLLLLDLEEDEETEGLSDVDVDVDVHGGQGE